MRVYIQVGAILLLSASLLYSVSIHAQTALSNNSDNNVNSGIAALVSRQQARLDTLENALKEVRGVVETGLRDIRQQLNNISASAVASQSSTANDIKSLQAELVKINDNIAVLNGRVSNSLNLYADLEFRIVRLEQRLTTLLSLSGEGTRDQLAQAEITAGGEAPAATLNQNQTLSQPVWTNDNNQPNSLSETVREQSDITQTLEEETVSKDTIENTEFILPTDESVEDQFRFALTKALQNDLVTAETAFGEFRTLYPDHERAADALFWLGRVQYIRGEFEKAATSFLQFNTTYSNDPRLPDTTLWIAESVSKFAESEQACNIYAELSGFLDDPSENFKNRLKELSDRANCTD